MGMGTLTQAIEMAESKAPWDKEEWDEFAHENFLRESSARTAQEEEGLGEGCRRQHC